MDLFFMCIKIFCARIIDVSLGTTRTVFVVKGKHFYSALIGFVEAFIWFLIVKDALNGSNSMWIIVSYASGFALGTYVGGKLSGKFIKLKLNIQIIIDAESEKLVEVLRDKQFAVSVVSANGYHDSNKLILFLEIDSDRLTELKELVNECEKDAFIVVNETKDVVNGYFVGISR